MRHLKFRLIPQSGDFYSAQIEESDVEVGRRPLRAMAMRCIPNAKLNLAQIPSPEGDLSEWDCFAHTINGYEVMGGFEPCADLANSGGAATLTELRCALFFEARRDHHSGGYSFDEALIRSLLKEIRLKVEAGDLA